MNANINLSLFVFYGFMECGLLRNSVEPRDHLRGKINESNVIKRIHLMQIICTQDSLSAADKVTAYKCVFVVCVFDSIQLDSAEKRSFYAL